MKKISLKAFDIFNMSFGQVFVAGHIEGQTELVRSGPWKLVVNGKEVAELEAVGEQFPKGASASRRVVSYKGSIDTATFNLATDEVVLFKVQQSTQPASAGLSA